MPEQLEVTLAKESLQAVARIGQVSAAARAHLTTWAARRARLLVPERDDFLVEHLRGHLHAGAHADALMVLENSQQPADQQAVLQRALDGDAIQGVSMLVGNGEIGRALGAVIMWFGDGPIAQTACQAVDADVLEVVIGKARANEFAAAVELIEIWCGEDRVLAASMRRAMNVYVFRRALSFDDLASAHAVIDEWCDDPVKAMQMRNEVMRVQSLRENSGASGTEPAGDPADSRYDTLLLAATAAGGEHAKVLLRHGPDLVLKIDREIGGLNDEALAKYSRRLATAMEGNTEWPEGFPARIREADHLVGAVAAAQDHFPDPDVTTDRSTPGGGNGVGLA